MLSIKEGIIFKTSYPNEKGKMIYTISVLESFEGEGRECNGEAFIGKKDEEQISLAPEN